jgi:menaquinone-dependent protoporphyrinogen oxidase
MHRIAAMSPILIVYQSRFGHCANVAEHLADRARDRGLRTTVLHVDVARGADLGLYDGVVLVAPVYFGGYPNGVMKFLRKRRVALAARPVAFVSVGNEAANADSAHQANVARKLQRIAVETGVRFDVVTAVAGALSYPRYGTLLRVAMKLQAYVAGTPTDTSRVHELTDWNALDRALAPFFAAFERANVPRTSPDESGIHRIADVSVLSRGPLVAPRRR